MTRSISSRSRFVFMMGAVLGLGLMSADAEAKKKRKKGAPTHIRMTGVKSFDTVFKQARKANNKLKAAQSDLRESKVALRAALGLSKRSTYEQGLRELKRRADGKLRVWIDGGRVQLKASDAVPSDVRKGVEAVNKLTRSIPSAVRNLNGVRKESTQMFKKAQRFPSNMQRELGRQGIDGLWDLLFRAPKITRKTIHNVRVIGAMPKRAAKTSAELVQVSTTIKDIF